MSIIYFDFILVNHRFHSTHFLIFSKRVVGIIIMIMLSSGDTMPK